MKEDFSFRADDFSHARNVSEAGVPSAKRGRGRPSVGEKHIRLEHIFKQQIYRGFKRAVYDKFQTYLRRSRGFFEDSSMFKDELKWIKQNKDVVVREFLSFYLEMP